MNILAIGAHPDDVEIACSGTLMRCVERGDRVVVCHVSDGNLGHVIIPPDELAVIRHEEACRAGRMGGYEVIWGGFHDLDIYENNKKSRDMMVDVIRYAKPDLIITHAPNDYMPDHCITSQLVFDASFSASVPHYRPELGEATPTTPIYYMCNASALNVTPTVYVDISEEMETKRQAFAAHESQIVWLKDHDNVDYVEQVEIIGRFYGLQSGVRYAEVFSECNTSGRVRTTRLLP